MAIPKPKSDLPWYPAEGKPRRPYIVTTTSPDQMCRLEHCIAYGNPTGGGPFPPAREMKDYQQDRDYIVWAANNAQKMYDYLKEMQDYLENDSDILHFGQSAMERFNKLIGEVENGA